MKKFNEWIVEQEEIPSDANHMQPSGKTSMAGNGYTPPALGNVGNTNDEQNEEEEIKNISKTMMTILDRLMPKLAKIKNKNVALEIVSLVIDKINEALPQITQTAIMKTVKNAMQSQELPNSSPHMPPQQTSPQQTPLE
jgi:hypothetical protein